METNTDVTQTLSNFIDRRSVKRACALFKLFESRQGLPFLFFVIYNIFLSLFVIILIFSLFVKLGKRYIAFRNFFGTNLCFLIQSGVFYFVIDAVWNSWNTSHDKDNCRSDVIVVHGASIFLNALLVFICTSELNFISAEIKTAGVRLFLRLCCWIKIWLRIGKVFFPSYIISF